MRTAAVMVTLLLAGSAFAQVVDEHVMAYWNLDEGEGTTVADSSANGNHGTNEGALWVEGISKTALEFDGVSARVVVPDSPSLHPASGDVTIEAWIQVFSDPTGWSSGGAIFFKGSAYQWVVNNNGALWLGIWGARLESIGTYEFQDHLNEWHHTATTYDSATQTAKIYVDGELNIEGIAAATIDQTTQVVYLGFKGDGGAYFHGLMDEVRVSDVVRTQEEIQAFMTSGVAPELAADPIPEDEVTDVPREVVLGWVAGEFAATHDLYLGTDFDDVNNASRGNPLDALVSQGQTAETYDAGRLELGQTYYWRVDEVNAAPDNTIFKGDVWSFTVEPLAYPIANIIATSNGAGKEGEGPENTINGSGLNAEDQHSTLIADMWLAGPVGGEPLYIQYEFDRVYKMHEMLVWNYNSAFELLLGFGIKTATVEYSADGAEWTVLGEVELAQGTGLETYAANTTVDFGGVAARFVKLTVVSGFGMVGQFGLSEVRPTAIPVQAREPNPDDAATDVSVSTSLSWRAGREAASHAVSLGTDPNALALVDTTDGTTVDPGPLDLAADYYWRVDEVNEAEAISAWAGDVWSFSTEEYVVIDDFESYDDEENRIYDAWLDGFVNDTGSTVGYFEAPFAERSITHGGGQSMPLAYDNTGGTTVSEATLALDTPQDWTQHGIRGLLIWFYGDTDNDPAQLYVKIDGSKVPYDGDAGNLARIPWQLWYIDLAGRDVSSVSELTIGIEGSGAGLLFIDDVMLSPYERQLVTPAEPEAANLVAHYALDGDTSDSTGAYPGTAVGNPPFVEGKIGQAIRLNGTGDYVDLVGFKGILGANPVTVAAWINTTNTETGAIMGWGANVAGQRFGFRIDVGRLRFEHQGGNVQGDSTVNDGAWHHVAVTIEANATVSYPEVILWLDGQDDTRVTTDPDAFNLTADLDARIGSRPSVDDRFFMGDIDEVYIYDKALSHAEIAWLAGRTQPFDTPAAGE